MSGRVCVCAKRHSVTVVHRLAEVREESPVDQTEVWQRDLTGVLDTPATHSSVHRLAEVREESPVDHKGVWQRDLARIYDMLCLITVPS